LNKETTRKLFRALLLARPSVTPRPPRASRQPTRMSDAAPRVEEVEVTLPASKHTVRGLRYRAAGASSEAKQDCGRWIFLHGWLDNAGSFDRLVPHLFSSGIATDITAIDMSGHGRSDHRRTAYHAVDYAAEVTLVANALYGSSDARFSLLGHSLGAGVALIAAGGEPSRIAQLVMLEGAGLIHTSGVSPAEQFSRAIRKLPSGNLVQFPTVEAACARRAERNVVPDESFTVDSARLLVERGLRKSADTDGGGYTWATDPWLMVPSRMYMPAETQLAFAERVQAPTLVLLTRDGVFRKLFRFPGVARLGVSNPLVALALVGTRSIASLSSRCLLPLLGLVGLGSIAARLKPALQRLTLTASSATAISQRLGAIPRHTVIAMPDGGHHPHIADSNKVADAIATWARGNGVASAAPGQTRPGTKAA